MTYARLCEHGFFEAHGFSAYGKPSIHRTESCPGGSVLPDDSLVMEKQDLAAVFAEFFASEFSDRSADDPVLLSVGRKLIRTLDALAAAQGSQE